MTPAPEKGYSEVAGHAALIMTKADHHALMEHLGVYAARNLPTGSPQYWNFMALVKRINAGHPDFDRLELPDVHL